MCLAIAVPSVLIGAIAYLTKMAKGSKFDPMSDAQNAAVNEYLRENPAPALLFDNTGVKPVYALDDRFLRKISKMEINGKLYSTKAVMKPELMGVRNSCTMLECTAHDTPTLLFDAVQLRQLKKDANIVLYCVTKVDFQDEKA